MITKELLSEVLEDNLCTYEKIESIQGICSMDNTIFRYQTNENTSPIDGSYIDTMREINIHELAHKCKDWASIEGFHFNEDVQGINIRTKTLDCRLVKNFTSEKEYDVNLIFKACEWIRVNK